MYMSSLPIHSPSPCQVLCNKLPLCFTANHVQHKSHRSQPAHRAEEGSVWGGLSSRVINLTQLFSPAHQRNLNEGNNQSSGYFLIQMQGTWTSPLAMLPTTSSRSVSLVNKLQVNCAAQHFPDFIPLFLNTAQMWLAHQPDYLHKDSRRRLPASFKSLEILLRLKTAFTGVRGGAEGAAVLLERCAKGKAAPSHSAPLCHPSGTSHTDNCKILPFSSSQR